MTEKENTSSATSAAVAPDAGSAPKAEAKPDPLEKPSKDKGADKQKKPTPRRGGLLATLAVLLSLAALGANAFLWYRIQLDDQNTSDRLTDTVRKFDSQLNSLRKIQKELGTKLDPIQTRQDDFSNSLEKLFREVSRSLDSWALEEVEQLLLLANHRLKLSADVEAALAGLEIADRRLRDIADPRLTDVRRALAEDVVALKTMKRADITGISLRLASLSNAVERLPLVSEPKPRQARVKTAAASTSNESWSNTWDEVLSDLKGIVRIQNITESQRPLLTPEQRYFLHANLQLMLSAAQIAALRADEATYRDRLSHAEAWLKEYFDTSDSSVRGAIDDVQTMSAQVIRPHLPDISRALQILSEFKRRSTGQ